MFCDGEYFNIKRILKRCLNLRGVGYSLLGRVDICVFDFMYIYMWSTDGVEKFEY